MEKNNLTIAGIYLRHLSTFLKTSEIAEWLSPLNPSVLDSDAVSISPDLLGRLILDASKRANEPALGLFLGQRLVATTHGFVGYAALSSGTFRQGLAILEEFISLRFSIVNLTHDEDENRLRIHVKMAFPMGESARPICEAVVLSVVNVLSAISLGAFDIQRLAFPFPKPTYVGLAQDLTKTHIEYDQTWCGIQMRADDLDRPLKLADAEVFEEAAEICREQLSELKADISVSNEVCRLLLEQEHGFPSLRTVAHRLSCTQRTLHRRLVDEGTSFRALLDGIRFRLAKDYLASERASLEEIAYMLGYTDSANFRRAFRRWSGVAPTVYRSQLNA